MAGPHALVDVDVVKDYLNERSGADDAELQAFINRATPIIEDLAGPVIQRTVTAEQHTTSGTRLALLQRPVVSVDSCTEYVGRVAYTVTVAADPSATGTYSATLDGDKGVLTRWASGTPRDWAGVVWVSYIAGRAAVPANIELATLVLVKHLWQSQRGQTPQPSFAGAELVPTPAGFAVPNAVIETLSNELRVDGFA